MQKLYKQLRGNELSDETLETLVAKYDHILRDSGAFAREANRWPESALADDADTVLNFAKERMAYLDAALYDLENFMN